MMIERATCFYADENDLLREPKPDADQPFSKERKCDPLSSGGKQGQARGHMGNEAENAGRLAV